MKPLYSQLIQRTSSGQRSLGVLIDPDEITPDDRLRRTLNLSAQSGANWLLYGGSLLERAGYEQGLEFIGRHSQLPVVLFPSNAGHVSKQADAILFLSLISGRNPELLIGKHVMSAPAIKDAGLEVLPTGYMLVDCGKSNTAIYMSNTRPIPYNKPGIAATTAMAGEMLGLQLMYLDGGSGAARPVSAQMVRAVKQATGVPLIVGGGIKSGEQAEALYCAGADMLVVGNAVEENPDLLLDLSSIVKNNGEVSRNIKP